MEKIFNAEEYKRKVSEENGVPIELLTATDRDGIDAQVRLAKAYIRSLNPKNQETTKMSFVDFMEEHGFGIKPDVSEMKATDNRGKFKEWAEQILN